MNRTKLTSPAFIYSTIAFCAMVLLFVYWSQVVALANLPRLEWFFKHAESIGDALTPYMPTYVGRTPRFAHNITYSWPNSGLVLQVIFTNGTSGWWRQLVFFASSGVYPPIFYIAHVLTIVFSIWTWDKLLYRNKVNFLLIRTALLSILSIPLFPVGMAIGFGAHVIWAKIDWTLAWSGAFIPERPVGSITVASLSAVLFAGLSTYFALFCWLFPFAARTVALFERHTNLLALACPSCGYALNRVEARCPECGEVSTLSDREKLHFQRAAKKFRFASMAFGLMTLVLLVAPLWMP
jgi:hypothetical protein